MKLPSSTLLALLFLCVIGVSTGSPCLSEEAKLQLDTIKAELSASETEITQITEELKEIKAEVQKLSVQVVALREREKKVKKELDQKQSSQAEIQKLVQDLQGRLLEIELRYQRRVRALYVLQASDTPSSRLLLSHGYEAFSRGAVYLKAIKRMDALEGQEIRELRSKRDVETYKLNQTLQQSQMLLADMALQRKEIESKLASQNQKVSEFQAKKKKLEVALVSLRAQELRFETVLKSMTGGEEQGAVVQKQPEDAQDREVGPWEGAGITGELTNPLKGKVIKKFGTGDGVTKKGILIKGGTPEVVAIAEGKVAFVGVLPQLGTVVILDHGSREFSLYGKLTEPHVSVGAIVPSGGSIGTTGDTFYFEIRKKGVSTDPLLNRYASP